jgi:putative selenate reductase
VTGLVPAPFPLLLRRMLREYEAEGKVFDVPSGRFWRGCDDLDLGVPVHGRRVANPSGPAAGPHGQLAQNLLLSWLAGGRFLELKTVQVNDRVKVPRPCIDMATVGYNVEWSQELRLAESRREYVKGSMLIDVARHEGLLGRPDDPARDAARLDLSVGYDLAGVRSPELRAWIAAMKDARDEVDALRREIPAEWGRLRDLDFESALTDHVTLSTFHGCPAAEIEAIAGFLMEEMELDVTVKLNPTLLGRPAVDGLLHDVLGYREIETRPEDFATDLQWPQALELVDRLSGRARSLSRGFRVKLSNTLVVKNASGSLPKGEPVAYLSGPPLHLIALQLVERFRRARPELPLSFSAGVDSRNFADCVAAGLAPVTTCSDLLKPGGYGRLPRYLESLEDHMRGLGVGSLGDFVVRACGRGEEAIARAVPDPELRRDLAAVLDADGVDMRGLLARMGREALYAPIVQAAAALNTPDVVARAMTDRRYRAEALRPHRRIGRRLALLDCLACDKCLSACPNDANFVFEVPPGTWTIPSYRVEGARAVPVPGGRLEVREHRQIACFRDFCNDCGNCDTFCPEEGGPYREKPGFFGSLDAWRRSGRDGFCVERLPGRDVMWGRLAGVPYELAVEPAADHAVFSDGRIRVELRHTARQPTRAIALSGAADGHLLDLGVYLRMAVLLAGVLDPRRANPVSVQPVLSSPPKPGGHDAEGPAS